MGWDFKMNSALASTVQYTAMLGKWSQLWWGKSLLASAPSSALRRLMGPYYRMMNHRPYKWYLANSWRNGDVFCKIFCSLKFWVQFTFKSINWFPPPPLRLFLRMVWKICFWGCFDQLQCFYQSNNQWDFLFFQWLKL